MRHISLPRGISHLGHKHQTSAPGNDGAQRPSPPKRAGSASSTNALSLEQKPLILKVYVIKARNLAAKDKSGTSDPYLVVTHGNAKQSTPSISKTLNPEWKICFDMPLTGVPLLECMCWDKDRFGKDYMGEYDIPIEDIFANGNIQQEPKWYKLKSRRAGKKETTVSGEVLMQFSIVDSANPSASPEEIRKKFHAYIGADEEDDDLSRVSTNVDAHGEDVDDFDEDLESVTESESPQKGSGLAEKTEKKKRLARLRRKSIAARAYNFLAADNEVNGIIFLEIVKITDLPPERNMTRTSFDMDPFVVAALGRKVLRTKVIRHNLNPVFHEKMVYQILRHETGFSLTFTVIDRDKLSGNDFVASSSFPIQKMIQDAPEEDPKTGLYDLPEPPEYSPAMVQKENKSRFRLPISRTSSASSLSKLSVPTYKREDSQSSLSLSTTTSNEAARPPPPTSMPSENGGNGGNGGSSAGSLKLTSATENPAAQPAEDPTMHPYVIPLELKNKDRWEAKHGPELHIRGRYLPYKALRQQFWRAMLKQYDTDESKRISKIELTTMLDTLGSTLKESTIDGFFARFASENQDGDHDLTFDQVLICLEERLQKIDEKKSTTDRVKDILAPSGQTGEPEVEENDDNSGVSTIQQKPLGAAGEEGKLLGNDLSDEGDGEEHVIEIRECPICHQPKLNKRTEADIITHLAICASSDWRQVNNLVMAGFVTQSQAQRKWYSKVITKIGYGGYKLGANSANILVQDRTTGQINEEKMSVYVRIGIRLLYKALGAREMEKKRIKKMLKSLSVKQGKKFDDPASVAQIEGFINFHRLDMSEVLQSTNQFKNFNEFFYRALKPDARPCSAPDRPEIIVSPADSRSVVFNTIDDATRIWVKGRDYSLEKLFGDAYPLEAKRYKGGSMGIFRLAPQDYHRFHVPVDGTLGTPKAIEGEYYTVNPMAIRSALDVYGENIRVLVPIDSVAHGRVMFVCIGAMMVGSTIITRKPGERVKRAEELGYFKFGGSTVLVFFEPGKMVYDDDLVDNSNGALETLVRVGMSIGHSPHVGPHKPDMKKDESSITVEDRREARRKIEGSIESDMTMAGFLTGSAGGGDGAAAVDQAHVR